MTSGVRADSRPAQPAQICAGEARAARTAFLAPLIGTPWSWRSHNCWEFAAFVQCGLFGRQLPHVVVPVEPSWRWMVQAVSSHPEHANWREVPAGPGGLVVAADGALCLMGRFHGPGHVGVWLRDEARVLHCDRKAGVCFETPLALRLQGWRELNFFEPKAVV